MALADRVAAARRLEDDAAAVSDRIVAAVEASIPTYATLPDAQRQEARAIAAWAVRRLLETWVDGTSLTDADRRRFHGIGVARATDGRPLFAVLRAYRVAAVAASDLVLELGGPGLDVDDVVALNRTLLTSIEDLSEALFTGYTVTQERLADDRDRSLSGLAHDLLSGRHVSRDALRDRAAHLGLTVPRHWCLVVAAPRDDAEPATAGEAAEVAVAVQRLVGPAASVLHAHRDAAVVVLASRAPDPGPLAAELDLRSWRACRVEEVDTDDLPRTHRLAAAAVRAAPRVADDRTVLGLADALYVGLLTGDPHADARALASATLGSVLDQRNRHLLDGLRAHLRHGSATEAAAALGLHPQTVRHRLRRVTALTGRDPAGVWDRLLLHTAVTALDATRADASGP